MHLTNWKKIRKNAFSEQPMRNRHKASRHQAPDWTGDIPQDNALKINISNECIGKWNWTTWQNQTMYQSMSIFLTSSCCMIPNSMPCQAAQSSTCGLQHLDSIETLNATVLLNHKQHHQQHQSPCPSVFIKKLRCWLRQWPTGFFIDFIVDLFNDSRELPEKPRRETTRNIWKFHRLSSFTTACLAEPERAWRPWIRPWSEINNRISELKESKRICLSAMRKWEKQTSKTMRPRNLYQKSDLPTNQTPKAIHAK